MRAPRDRPRSPGSWSPVSSGRVPTGNLTVFCRGLVERFGPCGRVVAQAQPIDPREPLRLIVTSSFSSTASRSAGGSPRAPSSSTDRPAGGPAGDVCTFLPAAGERAPASRARRAPGRAGGRAAVLDIEAGSSVSIGQNATVNRPGLLSANRDVRALLVRAAAPAPVAQGLLVRRPAAAAWPALRSWPPPGAISAKAARRGRRSAGGCRASDTPAAVAPPPPQHHPVGSVARAAQPRRAGRGGGCRGGTASWSRAHPTDRC